VAGQNYFDRFDIDPAADLTRPQRGMEQPRTPAELERARPQPTPATANFFDRYDTPSVETTAAPAADQGGGLSLGEAGRLFAVGAGDVVKGLADMPGLLANPLNAGLNWTGIPQALTGKPLRTDLGPAAREALGLPQGANARERILGEFISGAAGGGIGSTTARGLARVTTNPGVARAVLTEIGATPGMDIVGGAAAGAAAQGATEAQLPEWVQLAAGFAGGVGSAAGYQGLKAAVRPRVPSVLDADLIPGSLDGDVIDPDATLRQVGASPDQFSSLELADAAAQRAAAAQARQPGNFEGLPDIGRSRQSQEAYSRALEQLRAAREAGTLPSRVMPDDVPIIAAPEGNIRGDDIGGIAAVERKRSADSAVLTEGQRRVADDPVVAAVLDSNISPQMKVAALADRIERSTPRDAPIDTSVPGIDEGYRASNADAARDLVDRAAGNQRVSFTRPADGAVTSRFGTREGFRTDNGAQASTNHKGVDIGGGLGSPVRSAAEGEVVFVGNRGGYGTQIRVRHADGTTSSYSHLSAAGVKVGDRVNGGAQIGAVGQSGNATGPHLHFELLDRQGRHMDPSGALSGKAPAVEPTYRMSAPDDPTGFYSGRTQPNQGTGGMGAGPEQRTTLGEFENRDAMTSPTAAEMSAPGFETTTRTGASGGSDRLFKASADDAEWETRARATAEELHAKAMDDLKREWARRDQARQQRDANKGADQRFERDRTRTEEASAGDPSGLYGGKYDQRPSKAGDMWATTKEGFVAGKDGRPVAFRNAREAAKWAAKEKLGGDFEFVSWGSQNKAGTQRVTLRRRDGSTYGQARPADAAPPPPPRDFDGSPDYDRSATPDSRGKVIGAPGRFGPVHADLASDWRGAVARLQKDGTGEVPGAIQHPEIGSIDVVWGNQNYGLAKIMSRHPEVADDLPSIVAGLPIKARPEQTGNNRFVLEDDRYRAVISPDFEGEPKQWLITAFEMKKGAPGGPDISPRSPVPDGGSTGAGAVKPELASPRERGIETTSAPDVGARPPAVERPAVPASTRAPLTGKAEQVVTARGRAVDTQFEVHELRDLVSSDRPEFDQEFQPRDRAGRASSDAQVSDIASRLDPERLAGSREAAQGAPIVGSDRMVESGNGRVTAIRRAYEMHPERAAEYRAMVERQVPGASGFDQPVLVRRNVTPMTREERKAFVREANERDTMGMSSTEQAKGDAGAMTGDVLAIYRGGAVTDAGNRDFVRAWMDKVAAPAERNQLMMPDGSLSADGVRRLRSSLLAKAFDDADLVAKVVEDPDTEIRAIGSTLTDAAPGFAKLRERVSSGDLPREYDITRQVAEAANMIATARQQGKKIGDAFKQDDMFGGRTDPVTEAVARVMFKDEAMTKPRSAADMADGLRFYLDEVGKHDAVDMFGGGASRDRAVEVLDQARQRLDARAGGTSAKLFQRARDEGLGQWRGAAPLADELEPLLQHPNSAVRGLASHLRELVGDAEARFGDDLGEGVRGSASVDDAGRVSAAIRDRGDVETTLHEAVHVATLSRYGELVDGAVDGAAIAPQVRALEGLRERAAKAFARRSDDPSGQIAHALSSTDEFLAGGLTSPAVQAFLKRHNTAGLWGRFVDGVRDVLGLGPRYGSLLDKVLEQGAALIQRMEQDAPRSTGSSTLLSRDAGDSADKGWGRIADLEGFQGDVASVRRAFGEPRAALERFTRPMRDLTSAVFFTNDAKARTLAARHKSDAMREHADLFHAQAGKDGAVGRTYHEAVAVEATTRVQRTYEALEPQLRDPAAMGRIRDMLATPGKTVRATAAEREAARKVRDLLEETLTYRRAAGEDVGKVTDGYFPRVLDVDQVVKRKDEFLRRAETLYRGLSVPDANRAAADWFGRIFDEHAGIEGGLEFARAGAGGGVAAGSAKAREFGKQADELLREFYEPDVFSTLASYFTGSAKRAEHTRRFGMKGAVGSPERAAWIKEHGERGQWDVLKDRMRADLRKSSEAGNEVEGVLGVIDRIHQSNLGQFGTTNAKVRSGVAMMHAWNQLGTMDRTMVTSLNELAMGFVRGGPRYGTGFFMNSLGEFGRQVAGAAPSDARRWAEAIGVATDAQVTQLLTSRIGSDNGTKATQRVLAGFYKGNGLHAFTEATRTAAVRMGRQYLDTLAGDLRSESARVRQRAAFYLRELGVKDADAFGTAVRGGNLKPGDLHTGKGAAGEYGTALVRFVNQTVMMPSRAEKPTWAGHPVGSLAFSLLSYSYGFKKNVLDRTARLAVKGAKEKDATMLAPAFGLTVLAGFAALNDTYLRPALFGSNYDFENETPTDMALRVADRAGILGGASPIVNAFRGLKYDRSLAEAASGAAIGRAFQATERVGNAAFGRNSGNTATAERNAAAAVYDTVIEPGLDAIAAGRLKGAVRSAAIFGTGNNGKGLLPGDKEAFVSTVGGEPELVDDE
jgi:murein DD-endopeptidase MepM/ murein hydrolase activator NlpD